MRLWAGVAAVLGCLWTATGAVACGITHEAGEGETVFALAEQYYGTEQRWTLIYHANPEVLRGGVLDLPPGVLIDIPCLSPPPSAEALRAEDAPAGLTLLSAGGAMAHVDPQGGDHGLLTELVMAAMAASPDPVPVVIGREAELSRHLFPLLDTVAFDMGYPWPQPDCAADPADPRCTAFHYSEPIVELLTFLFVEAARPFGFDRDTDVHGRRLCRPAGDPTDDLDRAGRAWLSEGHITLDQPARLETCFERLLAGEVDAVAVDEFTGWRTLAEMGLLEQVAPLPRPVSTRSLHAVISKSHWRGTTHLYRINAGLQALQESGAYQEIVGRHLARFWAPEG